MSVAKNRLVRLTRHQPDQRVDRLTLPASGLLIYLKGIGPVKGLCQRFKHESWRYNVLSLREPDTLAKTTAADFKEVHTRPWRMECCHRAGKQLGALNRLRVRLKEAIHAHIFCVLQAFVELEWQVWHQQLGN